MTGWEKSIEALGGQIEVSLAMLTHPETLLT